MLNLHTHKIQSKNIHTLYSPMKVPSQFLIFGAIAIVAIAAFLISKKKKKATAQRTLGVKLVEKNQLTHDTYIFTFLLENQQEPLGLKVGEHLEINASIKETPDSQAELVCRKYTPISEVTKKGSFDLLIKVYKKCERFPLGGKLTQWLEERQVGEEITIKVPFGRFNYLGNGRVSVRNFGNQPPTVKTVKNFYMVAGGTGITPLYQIIQAVSNARENIKLTLLFLNRTEADILMTDELRNYEKTNANLKVYYSVDKVTTENWTGMSGFINKEKVAQTMSEVNLDTFYLSCGPPILCNLVEGIWTELGVPSTQIFRF